MKKFLLKAFMLLCLILWGGVSSVWAVTTDATMAAGTNGYTAKVNDKDAIKVGTSKAGGNMTITVPANSTSLTFYAAAWTGVSDLSLNITPKASVKTSSVSLTADTGITGNSPFTLAGNEEDYKFTIDLKDITTETTLTLTSSEAKRFVVWSATAEVVSNQAYTVTFNAGVNGTCSTASLEESAAGAGVTLPNVTANAGFNFVGWSTDDTPTSANAGAAGETYNPLSDCTLYAYYTVRRPDGEVFYESFDTNNGTGGNDDLWSGGIASNKISSDNENWTFANGSGANKCAKFGAGSALGSATTPAIAASGNFTLTFKAAAWNGSDEKTTLLLSATDATLSVSSVTLTKGAWDTYNVSITNATEGFTIKFAGADASKNRFFLDEVSVVKATSADITISAAGYTTYYNSTAAYTMPDDCEGYVFTAANGLELAYEAEEVVPAGEPLVIHSDVAGTKTLVFTTSTEDTYKSGDMNDLDGTDAETALTADENSYFYGLSLNAAGETASVGFYWMNATGAAFTNGAHKAYLKLPKSSGARSGFAFNEDTEAISTIEAEATATTTYNLSGQRVNDAKGLVIKNGKKIFVK